MIAKNCLKIQKMLSPSDVVLDIGGWAYPFNRANYIVDIMPYESRGIAGSQGPKKEHFSKKTWIVQDICSRKPLPFKDKEIDFVICSHTLEDIRDPLYVCSEIIRIAKRGYIEVPSRTLETIMGVNEKQYAGCAHHRWLIEIKDNKISFRFKNHHIYNSWRYHLPKSYLKRISSEDTVTYLFWDKSFTYEEIITLDDLRLRKEFEDFIKNKKAYPSIYYSIDKIIHPMPSVKTFSIKFPIIKKLIENILGRKLNQEIKTELFWASIPETHSK